MSKWFQDPTDGEAVQHSEREGYVQALTVQELRRWQGGPLLQGWPPSTARRCPGHTLSIG